MDHSNDFRYDAGLEDEAVRAEKVQVKFKDDPWDEFWELDITVYEFLMCKKHYDENPQKEIAIVLVWEAATKARSLRVRRLPQSKRRT